MDHIWGWANGGENLWDCSWNKDTCGRRFQGRGAGVVVRRWGVGFDFGTACTSMRWGSSCIVDPSFRVCDIGKWHMAGVLARHLEEVTKDDFPKGVKL